jgi:hypothetical protein
MVVIDISLDIGVPKIGPREALNGVRSRVTLKFEV